MNIRRNDKNASVGQPEKKNIRIAYLIPIWIIITLAVFIQLGRATRVFESALENQGDLTKKTIKCTKLAKQMQEGSDILTNAVWRFVATGEEVYASDYLTELEDTRSRDKAIAALRKEDLSAGELYSMEHAKWKSDLLMRKEMHCMRLVFDAQGVTVLPGVLASSEFELTEEERALTSQEKQRRALQFVFGDEYLQTKEEIQSQINTFTQSLEKRQNEELSLAMDNTEQARVMMQFTAVTLLLWCIILMICFYMLLIRPIRACCEELGSTDGQRELKLQGPFEMRQLIAAFNRAIAHIENKNEEIYKIQMVDTVTGGYTGARFDLEVAEKLRDGRQFAFISMDIRRFKVINDVYGSEEGDKVLREVYEILCSCLESGEVVSRIGSDVFNLIMNETEPDVIESRIEGIAQAIEQTHSQNGESTYHVFLNCGVYQTTEGEKDIVAIRDRANVARNISKNEAGYLTGCVFYTELERQRLLREQVMENQMEQALEREEFVVYLQPKVRLLDEKVAGAEALVRWDSEELGFMSPGDFIELFEHNGFIKKLDYYMFRQVCRLLRGWIDCGIEVVPVSVNLSKKYIREPQVVEELIKIQQEYNIPGSLVEFELTEAMALEDMPRFREIVRELHAAGCRCSMDDFGSGYSSLNVLKEIPVDVLKLDRGFFVGGDTERAHNVIKSVIKMAKELHMEVVSEGVESQTLVNFLREQGCDMVQGYVFFRPMSVEMFENKVLSVKKGQSA